MAYKCDECGNSDDTFVCSDCVEKGRVSSFEEGKKEGYQEGYDKGVEDEKEHQKDSDDSDTL